MKWDFDAVTSRAQTESIKWTSYPADVLPLWIADMDFPAPPAVTDVLKERISHGVFGYGQDSLELKELVCARLTDLYGWTVTPAEIVYLPGLVTGLNLVCRAVGKRGDAVLTNSPVYPPFLAAPVNQGRELKIAPLACSAEGELLHYELDFDVLSAQVPGAGGLYLFCNPQNPTGRAFSPLELERVAEFCVHHDLVLCSDEIHGDLMLGGSRHCPIAALDREIADRTITLLAPSKSFNIPGLGCSFAVIQNAALRRLFKDAGAGIVPHVNILGMHAAQAAYAYGQDWLRDLLVYLTQNRDWLLESARQEMPGMRFACPQATYLAWLDCRDLSLRGNPQHFFLEHARVALNDGAAFGPGGEGFVRLNFGCPRAVLREALTRMIGALRGLPVESLVQGCPDGTKAWTAPPTS